MTQELNAEVISIGTEILLGELTDTNSVFIARVLRDLGINLYYMTSVGDNEQRIANAISNALSRAQIVITCGGLGPTIDDMTRQAVARATQRGLTFHQHLLDQIIARFATFQATMTENNKRQAYLPDNAIVVENPVGTAPSFIVEYEGKIVISLPGVPREMKFLIAEKITPFLRQRYNLGIIKAKTLKAAGIGESALDEMIGSELLESANPSIGLAAHSGQIDVRITAKAPNEEEADNLIAQMEASLTGKIGRYIYGTDDTKLQDVLIDALRQHQEKIAIVQAGIPEAIIDMLRSSGGDDVIVAAQTFSTPDELKYAFSIQTSSLREIAIRAAEHLHSQVDSVASIAIVSYPDIDEASDTTEGSAIAIYTTDRTRHRAYGFGSKSEVAQQWITTWGMSSLWQMLQEKYYG